MVYVEVNDRDAPDAAMLQHAHRDGDVVERAEAFAVIRKCVMEPSTDVTANVERGDRRVRGEFLAFRRR